MTDEGVEVEEGYEENLPKGIDIHTVSKITFYYHQQLFYDNDWNMIRCPAYSSKIHLTIQITYCQTDLTLKSNFSSCQKKSKRLKKRFGTYSNFNFS